MDEQDTQQEPENTKEITGVQSRLNILKSLAKLFNVVVCNPSLTNLVPLWFIISLMFFYLY